MTDWYPRNHRVRLRPEQERASADEDMGLLAGGRRDSDGPVGGLIFDIIFMSEYSPVSKKGITPPKMLGGRLMVSYKRIGAVIFQEGNLWVAQCLEFDIAAQASTVKELGYELQRVLVGHVVSSLETGTPAV